MNRDSERAFAAPWHARAFALAVAQNDAGRFSWSEWTARFAIILRHSGRSQSMDGGEDYYLAWLATLESILVEEGSIVHGEIEMVEAELIKAHALTSHEPANAPSGGKSD